MFVPFKLLLITAEQRKVEVLVQFGLLQALPGNEAFESNDFPPRRLTQTVFQHWPRWVRRVRLATRFGLRELLPFGGYLRFPE